MIPIGALCKGMRVLTPIGLLARVDGLVIDTSRPKLQWANVTYRVPLDPLEPQGCVLTKLLRAYTGNPVVFPDELEDLQKRYAEQPHNAGGAHVGKL